MMWSRPQVFTRPLKERSQPSPSSASASCSQGLRKPVGERQPSGTPMQLHRAHVHGPVDHDLGHEPAAGADAQDPQRLAPAHRRARRGRSRTAASCRRHGVPARHGSAHGRRSRAFFLPPQIVQATAHSRRRPGLVKRVRQGEAGWTRRDCGREAFSTGALRRLARRRLPRMVFDFCDGGAEEERTLRANESAFADHELWPRPLERHQRRARRPSSSWA